MALTPNARLHHLFVWNDTLRKCSADHIALILKRVIDTANLGKLAHAQKFWCMAATLEFCAPTLLRQFSRQGSGVLLTHLQTGTCSPSQGYPVCGDGCTSCFCFVCIVRPMRGRSKVFLIVVKAYRTFSRIILGWCMSSSCPGYYFNHVWFTVWVCVVSPIVLYPYVEISRLVEVYRLCLHAFPFFGIAIVYSPILGMLASVSQNYGIVLLLTYVSRVVW